MLQVIENDLAVLSLVGSEVSASGTELAALAHRDKQANTAQHGTLATAVAVAVAV